MHYFLISNSPDSDQYILAIWKSKKATRDALEGEIFSYFQLRKGEWTTGYLPKINSLQLVENVWNELYCKQCYSKTAAVCMCYADNGYDHDGQCRCSCHPK